MGECSPYPKGRNPLNNKPRRRWENVLTLKEEILSQQHTKGKVPPWFVIKRISSFMVGEPSPFSFVCY
jgi:hypothetical protein